MTNPGSQANFRRFAQSIPNHVWTAPPDGQIDWFNDRVYAYSGLGAGELDGGKWSRIVHADDLPTATQAWAHALSSGEPYEVEFRLRRTDGQYRWHLSRAEAETDNSGTIIGWVGTNTDIDNQVGSASRLTLLAGTLERQVVARTGELHKSNKALLEESSQRHAAEAQTRQLQKMDALGQLTGGIAHDFNNMLAVIMGALALIERRLKRGDTDVQSLITSAHDGAGRAATLTQRLLAFARQMPLAPEAIDVNRLVKSISEMLHRTLPESVQAETVLGAGIWQVHADPTQLENALLNIAINARDAMDGGGKLTIETGNSHLDDGYARDNPDAKPGQYVLIAMSDTGSGMIPDVIAKIFDPFFTTKKVGQGTGLGLSQVYGFVKQSRGHIKVYSEPGRGTTFKIYLPRYYEKAEITAYKPKPSLTPLIGDLTECILVVEDDQRMREITVATLRELGYTVLHADNAAQALKSITQFPQITLLFTDVVMPEMSGRELAERVSLLRPELKILFTTGYARDAIVHNGVLDPGVNFIAKPFTIDDLSRKIRNVLSLPSQ